MARFFIDKTMTGKVPILHVLLDSPATLAELRTLLDISHPPVAWRLKWLCHERIVSLQDNGRCRKYCINVKSAMFLHTIFPAGRAAG